MKAELEWNKRILLLTLNINVLYPELAKFIEEMPVTIPDESNPTINLKILKEYYYTLFDLVKKYDQKVSLNENQIEKMNSL